MNTVTMYIPTTINVYLHTTKSINICNELVPVRVMLISTMFQSKGEEPELLPTSTDADSIGKSVQADPYNVGSKLCVVLLSSQS